MARTLMVAGNWKMNKSFLEGLVLANDAINHSLGSANITVVLATPFIHLHTVGGMLKDYSHYMKLAAQNCHYEPQGAYTGEISADMLRSVGAEYVILGHSERRAMGETDELLAKKVSAAIKAGLKVIFCVGESTEVRERNGQERFVKLQLERGLFHLADDEFRQVTIAYEPIWAIGTGKTATPEQAQEMHAYIRGLVRQCYNNLVADECTILYGGSCNALNANDLFSKYDIDGGLIGGASLRAEEFGNIVKARAAKQYIRN